MDARRRFYVFYFYCAAFKEPLEVEEVEPLQQLLLALTIVQVRLVSSAESRRVPHRCYPAFDDSSVSTIILVFHRVDTTPRHLRILQFLRI